jgi:ribosome recycling factor
MAKGKDVQKAVKKEPLKTAKEKKAEKEEGLISEDDLKSFEEDLQKEVDNLNAEIEAITKAKEDEIMKI